MSDTGMAEGLKLAELLCARLCHDLAGPIGAVATGAELLGDEGLGGMAAEALALLEASAASAGVRLRFMRLALGGIAGPQSDGALQDLASAFLAGTGAADSIRLDWKISCPNGWTGIKAKILVNLLLLARDSLPRGGQITVNQGADGAIEVVAKGVNARPGDSADALNARNTNELAPRAIQGYYAAQFAAAEGLKILVFPATELVAFRVG